MKARIIPQDDVMVVELSGYLDFETAKPLGDSFEEIYRTDKDARVVVDMSKLEFVGSSGISSFVKTLRVYNKLQMKPSYFGVKSEFVKLFRVFEEDTPFEVMESSDTAKQAALDRYNQWQAKTHRSTQTH